jgi:hypothetical protein
LRLPEQRKWLPTSEKKLKTRRSSTEKSPHAKLFVPNAENPREQASSATTAAHL